mmetsp:Transcript_14184/g.40207  ORF Transcript_14184/g.40207 Transcript_14184/m.40207 type:complete len:245 (-) Transcript_14184:2753-3487(-)
MWMQRWRGSSTRACQERSRGTGPRMTSRPPFGPKAAASTSGRRLETGAWNGSKASGGPFKLSSAHCRTSAYEGRSLAGRASKRERERERVSCDRVSCHDGSSRGVQVGGGAWNADFWDRVEHHVQGEFRGEGFEPQGRACAVPQAVVLRPRDVRWNVGLPVPLRREPRFELLEASESQEGQQRQERGVQAVHGRPLLGRGGQCVPQGADREQGGGRRMRGGRRGGAVQLQSSPWHADDHDPVVL